MKPHLQLDITDLDRIARGAERAGYILAYKRFKKIIKEKRNMLA